MDWLSGLSSEAAVSQGVQFSAPRFLEDLEKGSEAIGAPYSEETTKAILEAYGQNFHEGAVQLHTTSKPGDPFLFRLFTHRPIDATNIAVKHGFLEPSKGIHPLVDHWRTQFEGAYEQLEFTCDKGVTGAFMSLGTARSLNSLLDVPLAPESIKRNRAVFNELGLDLVRFVGADYATQNVAFYFIANGPLTEDLAAKFCALSGSAPPSPELYKDMSNTLGTDPFFFLVSMDYETGRITEVQFYILFPVEIRGELPEVGPRLATYWDIDCYDEEEMDILGWCFGERGTYLCADRGYCGGLRNILRDWKLIMEEMRRSVELQERPPQ